ncbi:MAG: DNA polymerase beta superfamily protein [Flavobacterium sp.]
MQLKILQKLNQIAQKKNVKILYAVESGSRVWGKMDKVFKEILDN